MARTQAVTRMVKGTKARYARFNLTSKALEEGLVTVIPASVGRTEEAVKKYLEKAYKDSTSHRFLYIEAIETYDVLMGMKLEDFVKYAVPLDENRRFPDGTETDDSEDSAKDGENK